MFGIVLLMAITTPNNFFGERTLGSVSAQPSDATSFEELRQRQIRDNVHALADVNRPVVDADTKKMSKGRKLATGALLAATVYTGAPYAVDAGRAVVNYVGDQVGSDQTFNPERNNPEVKPKTQDDLPGGNEIPPNAVRSQD